MSLFRKSLLVAAACCLVAAKAPEERPVDYSMRPILEKGVLTALEVEMRFRGDADGETRLALPTRWAGSAELWRNIVDLKVHGVRSIGGDYAMQLLRHRPGARIRLRYRVTTAYAGDPGFDYEKARPMVRPDWFFVHGESVFAVPEDRPEAPAGFRWRKLPRGWAVASDLDHLKGWRSTVVNIVDSVAIGAPDLIVETRMLGAAPLRVAIRGDWSFTPAALADTVATIVRAEDSYWGDESTPFLVAMAPLGTVPAGGLSSTGTGRTDAFSIASTSGFDLASAKRFLGHEYMHSWMPQAIGRMPERDEAVDYWLSEGFDDFLAARILLGSGQWSLADYIADKNEVLLRYGLSPAKRARGEEIAARFWSDNHVQQVSYDRGHLFAAILDARIRAASGGGRSLDDVMRAQRERARTEPALASALFPEVLRQVAGLDAAAEIAAHMRDGEPILLPADAFAGCARVATVKRRAFDRGFDAAATRRANDVLSGVAPDGPAFAAGLRNGMRLVRREGGKAGDSTVEVAYRIADAGGERSVRYLPQGREEYDVQQLVITAEGAEQERKCRAMLGWRS